MHFFLFLTREGIMEPAICEEILSVYSLDVIKKIRAMTNLVDTTRS